MSLGKRAVVFLSMAGSLFAGGNFRVGPLEGDLAIEDYDRSEEAVVREIRVKKGQRILFHRRFGEASKSLAQSGLVQPPGGKGAHLVTVWDKGAHGQIIHVWDLAQKKELLRCQRAFAWPMELRVKETHLVATGPGGAVDRETGIPERVRFHCKF